MIEWEITTFSNALLFKLVSKLPDTTVFKEAFSINQNIDIEFCTLIIGVAVLLVAFIIQKFLRLKSYISSFGVPIDQPPFFAQNFLFRQHDIKCLQKFGTVWARLDGAIPTLVVAEPELVKEVMVKKFDKFANRRDFGVEDRVRLLVLVGLVFIPKRPYKL